jgi:hypothetical protein
MSATAPASTAPAPIEARLDSICRRQQARFLDHLRDTKQATPRLEGDVCRFVGFVFADIKNAIHEPAKEAHHEHTATR